MKINKTTKLICRLSLKHTNYSSTPWRLDNNLLRPFKKRTTTYSYTLFCVSKVNNKCGPENQPKFLTLK